MKILKNNKGSSLIELVASIPLGVLIFAILTIVLISFMTSFQETKLYTQLQEELFDSIEVIRHGFLYDDLTGHNTDLPSTKKNLIGLLTANKVVFNASSRIIEVFPINLQGEAWISKAKFYLSDKKELKVDLTYPLGHVIGKRIFPYDNEDGKIKNKKIGNELQFQIINNDIFTVAKGTSEKPEIIGIHLIGQVRLREKGKKQTPDEDMRLNIRKVDYYTEVFVGNLE
ncbi:MAG: hypothetical protein K8S23_11860 [Candidatus Cloacimonetes bacterium]|nr:hypothetical protein [Candidatus Cloacimonadota bacterium]